jgi:hypothetical protein
VKEVQERVNSGCRSAIQALLKDNSSKFNHLDRIRLKTVDKNSSRLKQPTEERSAATPNTEIRLHRRSNLQLLHPPPAKLSTQARLRSQVARRRRMTSQQNVMKTGANRNVEGPVTDRSQSLQRSRRRMKAAKVAKQAARANNNKLEKRDHASD